MTGMAARELWFTSTWSSDMTGSDQSPTYEGLYMCEIDPTTGTCLDTPQLVVDKLDINGKHHRGLDLMNVSAPSRALIKSVDSSSLIPLSDNHS